MAVNTINNVTAIITSVDRWDHFLARWGINRMGHRVPPGLYRIGNPNAASPVFVSANYTLSFDALREALAGINGYILVLDTKGINVWCAAGKGTFGTEELISRIGETHITGVVRHRNLILPQLGAPGVAGWEVREKTGFTVEYGPIRALDLPLYLKTHEATPEMREVRFPLVDRLVLIPVELVNVLPLALVLGVIQFFFGGITSVFILSSAILAGVVLFPLLLPWLPTRDFSSKGLILGALVTLPFVLQRIISPGSNAVWWNQALWVLTRFLILPPITGYLSLNFTGATPFTSRTGVRREIYTYIPLMAGMFVTGVILEIVRFIL